MIVAAATTTADLPLGRGQLGVRALELGFPVAEQAGVFLVRVVAPEVLVGVEVVVGRGLGRPGRGDLRAVQAVARAHRADAGAAGARRLRSEGIRSEGIRGKGFGAGAFGVAGLGPGAFGVVRTWVAADALRGPAAGAAGRVTGSRSESTRVP